MSEFKVGEHVLVEYNSDGKYSIRKIAKIGSQTAQLIDGHYTTTWDLKKLHKVPKSILKELGL